jgi:hypothetical protein
VQPKSSPQKVQRPPKPQLYQHPEPPKTETPNQIIVVQTNHSTFTEKHLKEVIDKAILRTLGKAGLPPPSVPQKAIH